MSCAHRYRPSKFHSDTGCYIIYTKWLSAFFVALHQKGTDGRNYSAEEMMRSRSARGGSGGFSARA